MRKRIILSAITVISIVIVANLTLIGPNTSSLALAHEDDGPDGIVDKAQGASFKVHIKFKNTGTVAGAWSVNVAFEGNSWTWVGAARVLVLAPSKQELLTWNGSVPENAPVGSVSRLVVYHNDSFVAMDWWIHVVSGAELSIVSSTVK